MRPLRSPRKSARLATLAAATCATAMLTLTGCGDDDKGSPMVPPSASFPSMPSLKPLTMPPIEINTAPAAPTGSSGKPSASASSSAAAAPGVGSKAKAKDLTTVGTCLAKNAAGSLITASCTGEHVGEVAAVATLPESMNPSTPTYKEDIRAKCKDLLLPILDRQPNAADLAYIQSGPTEKSWAEDHDRTLGCIMTAKENVKLTAPLVK